jgi:hypothetical protein
MARSTVRKVMNWLGWLAHDYLGWHDGDGAGKRFGGASITGWCSRCGKRMLQDSQGGWFESWHQPRRPRNFKFRVKP